jgi:RHS repeat-associated protein
VASQFYYPFGGVRHISGTLPTSFGFTGQRDDGPSVDLMFYNARHLDTRTGRFISADTIVPGAGNPQALNRYSYVLNAPTRYTDPTGHFCYDLSYGAGAGQCFDPTTGTQLSPAPPRPAQAEIGLTASGKNMLGLCESMSAGTCTRAAANDLLARVLTREWSSIDTVSAENVRELLAHATTHTMYLKCWHDSGGQPCTNLTRNAILNWMGGYSSVAKDMYNGGLVPRVISPLARWVTNKIFTPPHAEWTRAMGAGIDHEPGYWGNQSMHPRVAREYSGIEAFLRNSGLGTPLWRYGQPGQDYFYVFTVGQGKALAVEEAKLAGQAGGQ